MAFISIKITGNGTAQTAVTNDATLEAVVNSLVAYNSTGGALSFSILINDSIVFTESVAANSTFRIPDKVNLGSTAVLKVNAPTGVSVTVSYLQQAIDVAGALSAAQLLAQAASDDADRAEAALGTTASPIITGGITIDGSLKETKVAMAANDVNLALGNVFTKTISGATTLTVSNIPTTGNVGYMILELTNAGSAAITWFSGVKWAGGAAPTLTASGKDIISMYTHDGGTVWNVSSIQKDVK